MVCPGCGASIHHKGLYHPHLATCPAYRGRRRRAAEARRVFWAGVRGRLAGRFQGMPTQTRFGFVSLVLGVAGLTAVTLVTPDGANASLVLSVVKDWAFWNLGMATAMLLPWPLVRR